MASRIRDTAAEDIPLLASLIRDSFRDVAERFNLTVDNCPVHPANCTDDWVESDFAKGIRYYVLEDDGTPCGCVAMEQARPGLCYLERLSVLPAYRRIGFGLALVLHVMEKARAAGSARVQIAIIAGQSELKRWYENLGFVVKDTRRFERLPFEVMFLTVEL